MSGELQVTSARERRNRGLFIVRASESLVVRMREVDATRLVFSGLISLPMLEAAQQFEDLQKKSGEENADKNTIVQNFLESEKKSAFLEFLQNYACIAVVEPKLVHVDDGNPDHLPVDNLTFEELMAIWNADPIRSEVPSKEEIQEFRRSEPEAARDDSRDGREVRPETKLVAVPERDGFSV